MAKKNEKKVSITALDNIISERFLNTTEEKWYDVDIKIQRNLSFTDTLTFVNDVVQSCFQDNDTYMPEVLDFAIRSNIIKRYTNVSLPDNLEHRYSILYNSDLVDFISRYINMRQLQDITDSINRKLSYMCDTNTAAIQKRLNDLVSAFEEMQKKTEDMFKDLTPGDMARLVGAIGDTGLSEEKVVKAYLDQTKPPKTENNKEATAE